MFIYNRGSSKPPGAGTKLMCFAISVKRNSCHILNPGPDPGCNPAHPPIQALNCHLSYFVQFCCPLCAWLCRSLQFTFFFLSRGCTVLSLITFSGFEQSSGSVTFDRLVLDDELLEDSLDFSSSPSSRQGKEVLISVLHLHLVKARKF